MSTFSVNLRFKRDEKRKSQTEIVDDIKQITGYDIKRSTYGSYEEGRAEPPFETIIVLADYFNVEPQVLFTHDLRTGKVPPAKPCREAEDFLSKYRKLPINIQKTVDIIFSTKY